MEMDLPRELEPMLISIACKLLGVTISPEQVVQMREDGPLNSEIVLDDILDAEYLSDE